MASPLISDSVRYKVDHAKFYFVRVTWRSILKSDRTTFEYVTKRQAVAIVAALLQNPFVSDVMVYDNEGNTKHFEPRYDEVYASELVKQLNEFEEQYTLTDCRHRTNIVWQKILLERRTQLKEAKISNPDKQCKLYKGRVMIKGVNCMINGSSRSDGSAFAPDCEAWWLKENLEDSEVRFSIDQLIKVGGVDADRR